MIQSPAGYQGDVRIKRYLDFYQAGYGVAMLSSGTTAFTPASLFAASEPGGWYDPSDLTTLYQDAAGTTPVTAVEQPVGLLLDKSKGLVLGSELVPNPGNPFVSTTGYSAGGLATISIDAGRLRVSQTVGFTDGVLCALPNNAFSTSTVISFTVDLGSSTLVQVQAGNGNFGNGGVITVNITASGTYNITTTTLSSGASGLTFKAGSTSNFFLSSVSVKQRPGNHLSQSTAAARPVLSARVNQLLATATLATQSVTTLATSYTLRFSGTGSVTLSGTATGTYSAGTNTISCTAGTLTLTVSGSVTLADLRPTNQVALLPAYQDVVTSTNYDTTGFPLYLKFDGTDDFLQSSTITPGSVDKAQVFAGVRKLSDAALGMLWEYSDSAGTNAGAMYQVPSVNTGGTSRILVRGASATNYIDFGPYTAPVTQVTSIAATTAAANAEAAISYRVNGAATSGTPSSNVATGNFGSYPLYVGRRGGTTLPFNGHLYSLILRFSAANLDAATITATETWVNGKTLAY